MEEDEYYPPGFRFYPTEEELVGFYLQKKLQGITTTRIDSVIPSIDIYSVEPWDLPQLAGEICRADREQWFFFTPRQEKETKGGRPSRSTATGFWKATGSPGYVYSSDKKIIAEKKSMVFYKGRAPNGSKTKWKMHEYRATASMPDQSTSTLVPKLRDEFSLCRVYVTSGTFQAFDRRPTTESISTKSSDAHVDNNVASAQDTPIMVEISNSSDTSHSGADPYVSALDFGGSSTSWEIPGSSELPLWEWELNWP